MTLGLGGVEQVWVQRRFCNRVGGVFGSISVGSSLDLADTASIVDFNMRGLILGWTQLIFASSQSFAYVFACDCLRGSGPAFARDECCLSLLEYLWSDTSR